MSFRGRGGPRGGGGRGGGGGFRGRGGGGGGGGGNNFRKFDAGPPERVIPVGYFDYVCQDDLVCKVTIEDVPYFNAPIFLENKEQIGKIDEIFGNLRDYYVSIKLGDNMKASSFKSQQKVRFDTVSIDEAWDECVLFQPHSFLIFCSSSSTRPNCCRCTDFCRRHHNQKDRRRRDHQEVLVAHVDVAVLEEGVAAAVEDAEAVSNIAS